VIDGDPLHGKIVDVRGGDSRANSKRGRRDKTVRLVEGDSSVGKLTSPGAGADPLGGAQGRNPQTVEQTPDHWFFSPAQPAPDLFDRDGAHPWFCSYPT